MISFSAQPLPSDGRGVGGPLLLMVPISNAVTLGKPSLRGRGRRKEGVRSLEGGLEYVLEA